MKKGIIKVTTSFNILNLPESNSCESVKHLVDDGLRLHKTGNYDEAIKCFDEAIQRDPDSIDAWEEKGRSLLYLGKHVAAETSYSTAKDCCDKILDKHQVIVDKLSKGGEAPRESKKKILKALSNKAELLCIFGNYDDALDCCKRAIRLDPECKEAWNNKGEALMFLKSYNEAIECYDKAIKLQEKDEAIKLQKEECGDADEAEPYNGKGKNYYLLKNNKEAIKWFDEAIKKSNETYEFAYNNKGKCLLERCEEDMKVERYDDQHKDIEKNYDDAIKCFDRALFLWKYYEEAKYYRDISYLKRGSFKYEKEEYRNALNDFNEIDNDTLKAQKSNNIGLCYFKMGANNQAEQAFVDAINSNELKLPDPFYNLGILYNNTNTPDSAKRLFDTCLKIDRNFTDAYKALKNMEGSHQLDWYAWWFGTPKGKKVKIANAKKDAKKQSGQASFKRVLGTGLITIILFLIGLIVYLDVGGKSLNSNEVAGLTIMTGFLVALLLLPSLTKFKVATFEMETTSPSTGPKIELEPKLADVPLEELRKKFTSRH